MKIIIAGAGAVGTHLAKLLSDEKQDIILMDENEEKLSKLDSNFDLMTVNASPTSISGLKNAGVAGADLFIGVMPEESRNMTACMLATNMGAKKTVARIDNYEYLLPKHKEFFSQLGVHSLIYPEMLAAKDIVDAIKMSWIRQWWEFCGGALVLIGTKMRETAEILNVPLHELGGRNIPFHIVAIKRGNETIIPRGDDVIKLHDNTAPPGCQALRGRKKRTSAAGSPLCFSIPGHGFGNTTRMVVPVPGVLSSSMRPW